MCYKTALQKKADELALKNPLKLKYPKEYTPYYHNDAFTNPTLYIIPQDDKDFVVPSIWGLAPNFVINSEKLDPSEYIKKYKTYNARGEEMFEKRSYKESAESERCLILADGFYEPHHYKGKSQPFFCYLDNRKLFAFAGIYTKLEEDSYTVSLVTTEANDLFAKIHNNKKRMPLVLDEQFHSDWLSDLNQKQVLELVDSGFTNEEFKYHPVTNEIYKSSGMDNPETQKPVSAFDPEFNQGSLF